MKAADSVDAPVPLLDLRRQYLTIRDDVRNAIDHICETQHLILGQEVENFEHEVATYTGVAECVSCASGTDAGSRRC